MTGSLSMAFLVLLETLSPVERAVFMLREVFGYGYPEVAAFVGRPEANRRRIRSRARQRMTASESGSDHSPARQSEAAELAGRFVEAAVGGDIESLMALPAPEVLIVADGGVARPGCWRPRRPAVPGWHPMW